MQRSDQEKTQFRRISRTHKSSFDGNTNSSSKWGHLCNFRIRTKKSKFLHRDGPAPKDTSKKSGNVVTLGALDSDVEEDKAFKEKRVTEAKRGSVADTSLVNTTASIASSKAMIIYFAKLARASESELVDFDFVESLLKGGGDVNFTDKHGQTVLHEVARNWHPDVAYFLLMHDANLNQVDKWGRSPLHSASAVDHDEMVQFLIQNEADLHIKSSGELQSPIHYAAKFNALESLKVLMDNNANVNDRDYKGRTPLFVAAEAAREDAVRYFVEQGVPVGVFDATGLSALSLMIEKMPSVAKESLQQFVNVDRAFRKEYYYLNYLEADPSTWMDLEARKNDKKKRKEAGERKRKVRVCPVSPLKVAVRCKELDILMHPVMQTLISVKWKLFGKWGSIIAASFHLAYILIWTWLAIFLPRDHNFYNPLSKNWWRIALEFMGIVMTFYFIIKQIWEGKTASKEQMSWRVWRTRELERDLAYCHPRWADEKQYLESEIRQTQLTTTAYFKDAWNIMDWLTYIGVLTVIVTRVLSIMSHNPTIDKMHPRVYAIALIFMWLHFMKSCRAFTSLGPFITMLGHVVIDTLRFTFLFFEFFIPYVCAFWIIFGGDENSKLMHSQGHTTEDWCAFNDLIYSVWMVTLMADVNTEAISSIDRLMAQILTGSYFAIASVLCLNLYIALLSDTFARVYENATANAALLQAQTILQIEKALWEKKKDRMEKYIHQECGPLEIGEVTENGGDDDECSREIARMTRTIISRFDNFEDGFMLAMQTSKEPGNGNKFQCESVDGVVNGESGEYISRILREREKDLQQLKKDITEIKHFLISCLTDSQSTKNGKFFTKPILAITSGNTPQETSSKEKFKQHQVHIHRANTNGKDLMRSIFNNKLTDIDELTGITKSRPSKKDKRRKRKSNSLETVESNGSYSNYSQDLSGSWDDLSSLAPSSYYA